MDIEGRKCEERNSCVSACINTLMNRDDCPHFFDGRPGQDAWRSLHRWVREQRKELMLFPYDIDPRPLMKDCDNEGYYMLLCHNGHGEHAVICKGGERVFDPGWIQSPIEGPLDNGFWIVGVVV